MLWAASPDAVPEETAPDWVTDWLERRRQREAKKTVSPPAESTGKKEPVDKKAQQRRAAQRESRVTDGLMRLDVWLNDLVRNGMATVETKPASFWSDAAKRLVDAQAPSLASRVGRLSGFPRSSPDWPRRLLAELGRIKLLIHAWERIDQLPAPLQIEVRQAIGWTTSQEELRLNGEKVEDLWVVIGQWVDEEDRLRTQRSWIMGRSTQRVALVLQFAPGRQAFSESILPGCEQEATLVFYPGTSAQRAKYLERTDKVVPLRTRPPGFDTIDNFLEHVAEQRSRGPWLSSFGTVLRDTTLVPREDGWFVRDQSGQSLALRGSSHWKILSVTGGLPFDLAGEWDGERLKPMGFFFKEGYRIA